MPNRDWPWACLPSKAGLLGMAGDMLVRSWTVPRLFFVEWQEYALSHCALQGIIQ